VTIIVRPARPEDVDDVVDIGLTSWREGFRGVVPGDLMPDAEGLRARIRERIAFWNDLRRKRKPDSE